ncbi:lipocalin family protein [Subsaxibacter sp. CAU 1640]|uniref:lipocalin family protein n=1 Tax=Subsaxibacter sp. CAU 1640 TaxID=2933271 RepID=UPI00200613E4|nr:lipocalin family protein [Subsaxibacter sp. CAU 1640]MCK7590760.1 lipocalin family protein [Subsaxibacter sp. CAU 1640]
MNTHKLLMVLILALGLVACSGDDDGDSSQQMTNAELLVGKWYFEARSGGSYTACEKTGYIQFRNDGTFTLESFEDDAGACVSTGAVSGTYTLTNSINITLMAGTESQTATIQSITQSQLVVTDTGSGEVNTFDKTAG